MPPPKGSALLTVGLAFCAGFCDATTFVAAHALLSASITGNLVVFAADMARHADAHTWEKLGSFPVFVLALATARAVARHLARVDALLLLEGGLLLLASLLALADTQLATGPTLSKAAALLVVFAMGVQNAFGTLAGQQVLGPTTVMTGKLTQLVFAGIELHDTPAMATASQLSLRTQAPIFGGFLGGCLMGASLATAWGLLVVAVPGLLLTGYGWLSQRRPIYGAA